MLFSDHTAQSITLLTLSIILADLLLGDPHYRLHPIRIIGQLLNYFEKQLYKIGLSNQLGGVILFILLSATALGSYLIIAYCLTHIPGQISAICLFLWELYMGWSLLALKDLMVHGDRVKLALQEGNLVESRKAVGFLVSRDTDQMDSHACARATVESLSENIVDGVISPLIYLILFGIPGMLLFKIISTMDSMVGYKNRRYLQFGWFGARADDLLNYLPSRITWLTLSVTAALLPNFSGRLALTCGWRQHHLLPSPNSGWSEAATAGALQRRLLGPTYRQGALTTEPWIGHSTSTHCVEYPDIVKTQQLLYATVLSTLLMVSVPTIILLTFLPT